MKNFEGKNLTKIHDLEAKIRPKFNFSFFENWLKSKFAQFRKSKIHKNHNFESPKIYRILNFGNLKKTF